MKRLCWSILMILPLGASAADVYRSVDANGVVVYSDRPSENTELVEVNTGTAARQATATLESDDSDTDDSDPDSPLIAEIPREATPAEVAADRARNCEYSQQMATTYSESHRLYRNDANGERVYLSDAEIDEARSKAESNVATWCD